MADWPLMHVSPRGWEEWACTLLHLLPALGSCSRHDCGCKQSTAFCACRAHPSDAWCMTACRPASDSLLRVQCAQVGQTLVIALAIACHNLIELGGPGSRNPATRDGHLFSLILMAPLAGCTYGLAGFNWFPAQVNTQQRWVT